MTGLSNVASSVFFCVRRLATWMGIATQPLPPLSSTLQPRPGRTRPSRPKAASRCPRDRVRRLSLVLRNRFRLAAGQAARNRPQRALLAFAAARLQSGVTADVTAECFATTSLLVQDL
jgi:hypothetical protein